MAESLTTTGIWNEAPLRRDELPYLSLLREALKVEPWFPPSVEGLRLALKEAQNAGLDPSRLYRAAVLHYEGRFPAPKWQEVKPYQDVAPKSQVPSSTPSAARSSEAPPNPAPNPNAL